MASPVRKMVTIRQITTTIITITTHRARVEHTMDISFIKTQMAVIILMVMDPKYM